ncbi:MAG: hypothetical protein ACOYMG_12125 [Candidatus Methylumidiphilus sp.]
MKKIITTSLFCFLFIISFPTFSASTTLNFEGLADSAAVTNPYSGITFSNTVALTAGFSLNQTDYPPHSGAGVVGDDGNGPMGIVFSNPADDVSAWFTFGSLLTINAYGANGSFLGSVNSGASNNFGSVVQIAMGYQGIGSLQIAGAVPGTFVMDDLSFTSSTVPIPAAVWMVGSALVGLFGFMRKSST